MIAGVNLGAGTRREVSAKLHAKEAEASTYIGKNQGNLEKALSAPKVMEMLAAAFDVAWLW